MRLKLHAPTETLIDEEVSKVIAEAQNGSFCLLPHHIDFAAALVPGLLSFETTKGDEIFLAVDEGILVKKGSEVQVSCRYAIKGRDLGKLKQAVKAEFYHLDEKEKQLRSSLAKLEADFIRRFVELGRPNYARKTT